MFFCGGRIDFEVDVEYEAKEKDACFASWQSLMKEEVPASLFVKSDEQSRMKKRTILAHCIDHLRDALTQRSHAIIAGACRVICLTPLLTLFQT